MPPKTPRSDFSAWAFLIVVNVHFLDFVGHSYVRLEQGQRMESSRAMFLTHPLPQANSPPGSGLLPLP
jgi:hypothetical protein